MISLASGIQPRIAVLENSQGTEMLRGSTLVKRGFAHMQKHGVIMDVTTAEQAQIAEKAGAVAVMVLDKLPYDDRKGGV